MNKLIGVETLLPNGMFKISHRDVLKPRNLDPIEKIALEKKHDHLQDKAEVRQEFCWMREGFDCSRKAEIWVHEVGFDFKGSKAAIGDHFAISSADYPGPVPGFCPFCLSTGPITLVQAVFDNRPEMHFGVRPYRWFVLFTDGTRQGGACEEIPSWHQLPKIEERFTNA